MNQCQWKGAQFDGLKLRLKTEDLGYRWLKKGCFGYQALGSYCLAVPQANHCSEFRMPQWSILLNCLWPIAKAIFVDKVQILILHSHWSFIPETHRNLRWKPIWCLHTKLGTISAEQTLKRRAIKRFLYSRDTATETNQGIRYAKEVWTGLISTCLSGNVRVVWIETG